MKILTAFISLLYLTLLLLGVFALSKPSIAVAEDLTTSNLTPNMSDMTASGGTSVGTGSGCIALLELQGAEARIHQLLMCR